MPPQGSAAGSGERSPDEESILNGWVRRYYALQQDDLKPWILCDSSVQGFSYVNVSVKGARNNNEDAIYADGQMFAVYDRMHCEKNSQCMRVEVETIAGRKEMF